MLWGHWWNGSWGRWQRCNIWLEQLDDGCYLVRWSGGDWTDREGRYINPSPILALVAVGELLQSGPGKWREITSR
jgi:hypothetical protein